MPLSARYVAPMREAVAAGEHWVTINGTHVLVDAEGVIRQGAPGLRGTRVSDLSGPATHHPPGHDPRSTRPPLTPEQRAEAGRRGIALPPTAWGVEFRPPEEKVQATWYDAKGRRQYAYSPAAVADRDAHKFHALHAFSARLPQIRQTVAHDLRLPDAAQKRVAAAVVTLIDKGVMRVGSDIYARTNGTYGASSLRKEHVQVEENGTVRAQFTGKHGVAHDKTIPGDEALAATILHLRSLPGDRLFQHHAGAATTGALAPLDEAKVNAYLSQFGVTAKQFRTYHASRLAAEYLGEMGPAASATEARANITAAVKKTAAVLGNTPAVCRSSYINPAILDAYTKGVSHADRAPAGAR